ncbi:secreted in xylem 6-like protein [Fusarium oxysporum f. sp. albedinis]|nr:secreted in xylem 6-like protein [Fusarium oxysporum f. sp. albedinis]KAK2468894.1 hypothetical protein H9L39_19486 [Fusarium oxysporum f. sp. albedinis]
MKFALIASIFIAGCVASPLVEAQAESAEHINEIKYVDIAPAELEPKNANLVSRDTLPVTSCPAGQTYDRSVCFKSDRIRSFCVANPRQNREQITDTPCKPQEVCVQRNLSTGKSYAKCIPIHNLVSWKTSPDGGEGCTTSKVTPSGYYSLGTILYDVNKNPIQVNKIKYLGEPGDKDEGIGGSTSSFSSSIFNFVSGQYMKTCVTSGGSGNLNAYTWSWK